MIDIIENESILGHPVIEEDQVSWIKSIKPVKVNEVVLSNDQSLVVNVVNWGRSNELNIILKLVKFNEVVS